MSESGWEAENELARSMGWEPILDPWRGSGWCKFNKGDWWVWRATYPFWVRARVVHGDEGSMFTEHLQFADLKLAFSEESSDDSTIVVRDPDAGIYGMGNVFGR